MALLHVTPLYHGLVTSVNPAMTTAFTVPAGYRYKLADILVRNQWTGGANHAYLFMDGTTLATLFPGSGGSGTDTIDFQTAVVFGPGQTCKVAVSNGTGVWFTLSGYLYTI